MFAILRPGGECITKMGLPAPILRGGGRTPSMQRSGKAGHLAEAAHGLGDSERVKDTELSPVTGARGLREEDAIRHREDAAARSLVQRGRHDLPNHSEKLLL